MTPTHRTILTSMALSFITVIFAFADTPTITDVTAKQRRPWNGKVDIIFSLASDITSFLDISAEDRESGTKYIATASALSGDLGTAAGTHHVVWDLSAQGLEFKSDDVVFKVGYQKKTQYCPQYCVINLSAGSSASSFPVTYLDEPPSGGFNTDEYKTTKLVLRLIEPGTFMMCGQYQTTLTKPYYCGIFEVTQKQFSLVTGSNPSWTSGDTRPVEQVSWNMIRGQSDIYNWPTSGNVDQDSFMGRLRSRTGVDFDLPTEAQWEYACRAGTTSNYNNGGDAENDLKLLGRYGVTRSTSHAAVGSYLPNAWGLYDMHGNVYEWCLDWYGNLSSPLTDPKGSYSGSSKVLRGGCWGHGPETCASSYRQRTDYNSPGSRNDGNGFRVFCTLSESCSGDVNYSGSSASVEIDSRLTPLVESIGITWNAFWIGGDTNATVTISDNGVEIIHTTGTDEVNYSPTEPGRHELTYSTYIDGVVQGEVYHAVVFKDWKYEVIQGGAIITDTTLRSGSVQIPSKIDGHSVTGIANNLFADCANLKSVTIPNSVTSIGANAFAGCSGLSSVEIPASVTSIGNRAFANNSGLMSVTVPGQINMSLAFPDSYQSITNAIVAVGSVYVKDGEFKGCSGLMSVTIPESVTNIGAEAFSNCLKLKTVNVVPTEDMHIDAGAFDGCPSLWSEWYKTLIAATAQRQKGGEVQDAVAAYSLTNAPADRAIASITVNADMAINEFVLKNGKVYDSVLHVTNPTDSAVKLTLPAGNTYQTFKGAKPLSIPANSANIVTITRVGENVFLVTREELETLQ